MLCVYPYCLSCCLGMRYTSLSRIILLETRERRVLDYLARALSLQRVEDLSLTFVGRHGGSIVFLFLHPISLQREGNENFRARSKGASEFSLSLSSDFSFWFLNIIIMYYLLFLRNSSNTHDSTNSNVGGRTIQNKIPLSLFLLLFKYRYTYSYHPSTYVTPPTFLSRNGLRTWE